MDWQLVHSASNPRQSAASEVSLDLVMLFSGPFSSFASVAGRGLDRVGSTSRTR